MRIRWILAVLALPFTMASANQVINPEFDANTEHWGFQLDIGGGGSVDWDSAIGNPVAGSARAGNVFIGERTDGWKQCVPISGNDFAFQNAVASALQAGNHCRITLDFIAATNCIDGTPIALQIVLNNTINTGGFETLSASGALPHGTLAAAVFLDHVRSANAAAGDSFCHFDDIQLDTNTVFAAGFE